MFRTGLLSEGRIPVIPAVVHEYDPIIVTSPPTAIVPLPVVLAETRIPLAAERGTTPVISDSYIAPTIIGRVRCPIDRIVSITIDGYAIATAKPLRVRRTSTL